MDDYYALPQAPPDLPVPPSQQPTPLSLNQASPIMHAPSATRRAPTASLPTNPNPNHAHHHHHHHHHNPNANTSSPYRQFTWSLHDATATPRAKSSPYSQPQQGLPTPSPVPNTATPTATTTSTTTTNNNNNNATAVAANHTPHNQLSHAAAPPSSTAPNEPVTAAAAAAAAAAGAESEATPKRKRAKRMNPDEYTQLIEICLQNKGFCTSSRGNKSFWITVAQDFRAATGRDEFNWQTGQKKVLTSTEEHRVWLRERLPATQYPGLPGMCDALDEWTAFLDDLQAHERALQNVAQPGADQSAGGPSATPSSQGTKRSYSMSGMGGDGAGPKAGPKTAGVAVDEQRAGRSPQATRRRMSSDGRRPYLLSENIDGFLRTVADQCQQEGDLRTRVDNIERQLGNISRRLDQLDKLDRIMELLDSKH